MMSEQDKEALWMILDRNGVRETQRMIEKYRRVHRQEAKDPYEEYMKEDK